MTGNIDNQMLAAIVAEVVGRVLPTAVEREVAGQVDGLADGMFAVIDAGARERIDEIVHRSYGLHCARVAIALDVGVAEYAKIRREMREAEGDQTVQAANEGDQT